MNYAAYVVSIHAPTRGATGIAHTSLWNVLAFQSTHPHGVRQHRLCRKSRLPKFQSTHPHGVRQSLQAFGHFCMRFQSTHPHGVRPDCRVFDIAQAGVSIHAPTRGATDCHIRFHCFHVRFNPRTHTGCDLVPVNAFHLGFVSIHAPTRGATGNSEPYGVYIDVSIHAPTRGATARRKACANV